VTSEPGGPPNAVPLPPNAIRLPPILGHSALTGRVWIVTRYTVAPDGTVIAHTKHDVTEQFDRIAELRAAARTDADQ
jgi:hypothetical protein